MSVEAKPDPLTTWVERFRYYRDPPDKAAIEAWLNLFNAEHQAVAAKVLDNVVIVSERQIHEGYRRALNNLDGWHLDEAQRKGRWFFVGFGKPSESGPAMLRLFKEANDMAVAKYEPLFRSLADLPALKLTALDTVVFIDDFAGTGRQVCKMWPIVAELVASEATCHLVLTAATADATEAIAQRTTLLCHADAVLPPDANIFADACETFTPEEKAVIESYGERADPRNPKGFGRCGLLFVLSHKTPNNSIPILHVNEVERWVGLFPRYLKVAA